jgi:two-component system cell cycle sensor histidine kinase/response regulator CckA
VRKRAGLDVDVARGQRQDGAIGHGIARIDREVDDHLLDARDVDHDRMEIVAELCDYRDALAQGAGSTFYVFLPSTNHPATVRILDADAVRPPSPVGDETILLVEDEAGVRQFVALALERHGYRVLEAHSAEAALTLLQGLSCPIHLVLSDMVLPGIDGCELAGRAARTHPHVPFLLTTGYVDSLSALHTRRGLAVLEKPFSARTLLEKAREPLDRSPV